MYGDNGNGVMATNEKKWLKLSTSGVKEER